MLNSDNPIDYREPLIEKQLRKVRNIYIFASGKGGVGKSLIATTTALLYAEAGYKTGLLDLDLHGPSSSTILNVDEFPREEEEGLYPPEKYGLRIMNIELFVGENPIPIDGFKKREIIKEVLALTYWGDLDYLIIDMPPETGDVLLSTLTLLHGNMRIYLVSTPSKLSYKVVERLVKILRDYNVYIQGLIENMYRLEYGDVEISPFGDKNYLEILSRYGITLLGRLPLDPTASQAADDGDIERLLKTRFASELRRILGIS